MFKQILKTTKKLTYDFSENFLHPIHKVMYELIREGRYSAVTKLLEWDQSRKVKEVVIKNTACLVFSLSFSSEMKVILSWQ